MIYGLIGEHLTHSYSREIHEQIADYKYELCELAPDELDNFFKDRSFKAINVTIPYKQSVIPYLDEVSKVAQDIGAVNTIVNRNGKLYGYNTDFAGMKALIENAGIEVAGKKVLILGTGGTSKTAHAVAEDLGAKEIIHVSRKSGEKTVTYDEAYTLHSDAQVVINTTPVGMYPNTGSCPIDITKFNKLTGIADAIYNPLRTNLVLNGTEAGITSVGGLYMLAAQAVYASSLFLDIHVDTALIEKAYNSVLSEKRNIALIGMPTSGKTTIGKYLAEKTGRELIDTDDVIVDKIGMPISKYFELKGEASFRAIESETVREVSSQSGKIIATGGGTVLNPMNIRELKKNSIIVFLDRSLKYLTSTSDRPLSSSIDAVKKLFIERYPLYNEAADIKINADGDLDSIAENIYLSVWRKS